MTEGPVCRTPERRRGRSGPAAGTKRTESPKAVDQHSNRVVDQHGIESWTGMANGVAQNRGPVWQTESPRIVDQHGKQSHRESWAGMANRVENRGSAC